MTKIVRRTLSTATAPLCIACLFLLTVGCQSDDQGAVDSDAGEAPACIADHPRGDEPVADPELLDSYLANCRDDSGTCMASSPCTGTAAGRVCDASRLITEEAAGCIARAGGISEGLEGLRIQLGYNYGHRRMVWNVTNVLSRSSPDAGPGSFRQDGDAWSVDAVTGEILAKLLYETEA